MHIWKVATWEKSFWKVPNIKNLGWVEFKGKVEFRVSRCILKVGWVQENKMYTQGRPGSGEQDVSSWLVGFRRTRYLLRGGWVQEKKMFTQGRLSSGEQDVYSG